ncbi:hypothetical protein C7B70_00665 [Chlorogloea sp. CCALA 695]|nr:hypothetical protein C7B70_00665 [Chlorogloea sp. CCALA 695]
MGWQEVSDYEATIHNLVWAIAVKGEDHNIVNYNTYKLERYGVTSINLVIKPEYLSHSKVRTRKIDC